MATKTITITEDAYNILRSWRTDKESFSQIITKIGRRPKLSDYAGILSEKKANRILAEIRESRSKDYERYEKMLK